MNLLNHLKSPIKNCSTVLNCNNCYYHINKFNTTNSKCVLYINTKGFKARKYTFFKDRK